MAASSDKSVKTEFARSLAARPGSFSFFAAVRRLEQLRPHGAPVGTLGGAVEPVVRFAQTPHLYFPPSELFGYAPGGEGTGTLQVYFFGLFGPGGALPLALTDYVHARGRHFYDLTMQRFADIFHDRLIALFYRAGTRGEAAVSYDPWANTSQPLPVCRTAGKAPPFRLPRPFQAFRNCSVKTGR